MKIVIAPDSFKGSMSAVEACAAMARGVRRAAPDARIVTIPLADGGEGTVEALIAATDGQWRGALVMGPLGEPVEARYGLLDEGRTAVIEMAAAAGLPLVPADRRDPTQTTTHGLGELIGRAFDDGARRFLIGIGGSATNDGGAGMAQALGVRFLQEGAEIEGLMNGGRMSEVDGVDASGMNPDLQSCELVVACDVDNPLLGPRGATHVYGPQKGATPEQCERLEAGMENLFDHVERDVGKSVRNASGAGAAGGLGAALMAFLGASLRPGIDIVLEQTDFAGRIADADLILTGEGRLDVQTAYGKTISGVARAANGIPVVALAGSLDEELREQVSPSREHARAAPDRKAEAALGERPADILRAIGLHAWFSICPAPLGLDEATARGAEFLEAGAEQVTRLFFARRAPDGWPGR